MTFKEEFKKKIETMLSGRKAEIEKLEKALAEAEAEADKAAKHLEQFSILDDFEAYEEADNARRKADYYVSVYRRQLEELRNKPYVTEEESNRLLDQLEKEAEKERKANEEKARALAVKLVELANIDTETTDEYRSLYKAWTEDIHEDYRHRRNLDYFNVLNAIKRFAGSDFIKVWREDFVSWIGTPSQENIFGIINK